MSWAPYQPWQSCKELDYVHCHVRKWYFSALKQECRMTSCVKSVMKCKKSVRSFKTLSVWFLVMLHKKEMVVAVKATMYHVNSSIFALTIGAGQRGFCWYFIPNHQENHVQNFAKTEMKSDFLWKRQTFHLNPVASSASALGIRAQRSCKAAQI